MNYIKWQYPRSEPLLSLQIHSNLVCSENENIIEDVLSTLLAQVGLKGKFLT